MLLMLPIIYIYGIFPIVPQLGILTHIFKFYLKFFFTIFYIVFDYEPIKYYIKNSTKKFKIQNSKL